MQKKLSELCEELFRLQGLLVLIRLIADCAAQAIACVAGCGGDVAILVQRAGCVVCRVDFDIRVLFIQQLDAYLGRENAHELDVLAACVL